MSHGEEGIGVEPDRLRLRLPIPARPVQGDLLGPATADRIGLGDDLGEVGFGPGLELFPVEDQPLIFEA